MTSSSLNVTNTSRLENDQARIDAMVARLDAQRLERTKQTPQWRLATRLFRDYRRH